jgi:hypothetical protein
MLARSQIEIPSHRQTGKAHCFPNNTPVIIRKTRGSRALVKRSVSIAVIHVSLVGFPAHWRKADITSVFDGKKGERLVKT